MNKLIPLTIIVILSVLLAACGQATQAPDPVNDATQPSGEPAATEAQTVESSPYPSAGEQEESSGAYPGAVTIPQVLVPYPAPIGYELAKYISLEDLKNYITSGEAIDIVVTANQEVFVKLSETSAVWTNNMTADVVTQVILACGAACKDIPLTLP